MSVDNTMRPTPDGRRMVDMDDYQEHRCIDCDGVINQTCTCLHPHVSAEVWEQYCTGCRTYWDDTNRVDPEFLCDRCLDEIEERLDRESAADSRDLNQ